MTKIQMKQKLNDTYKKIGELCLEMQLIMINVDIKAIEIPFLCEQIKEELLYGVLLHELIYSNKNDKSYHNVAKNR